MSVEMSVNSETLDQNSVQERGAVGESNTSTMDPQGKIQEGNKVPEDKRFDSIMSIPTEFFQEPELLALLAASSSGKKEVICYDGFEPSGRMHIAQGLLRTINTNKLTNCGFTFIFWVADWFAQLNLKLDGDLKKIRKAGELMIEIWKACGMDMTRVKFLWASEEINKNPNKYWSTVMDISSKFNLNRVLRCTQIMGRDNTDNLAASQIFYPIMQCADIFFLNVDICSLGLDQRKVNTMALEYCDKIKKKFKPIILSHAMLRGLDGSDKMSKSNPDNAIFMDDEPADVKRKIKKAFCEPKNIEVNPILEYYKHIVFNLEPVITLVVSKTLPNVGSSTSSTSDTSTSINRVTYTCYNTLETDFTNGSLHPADLKPDLIDRINKYLAPVINHFRENKSAAELLNIVRRYRPTKADISE